MTDTNTIPEGYSFYSLKDGKLVVGVDFSCIGQKAPNEIVYEGRTYKRDMLEMLPLELASTFCSMRSYKGQPTKKEIAIKAKAFQDDLKALLKKHNATIAWQCADCSDTHGIYDEEMVIEDNEFGTKLFEVSGSTISVRDL
jgi:hypothetical protein